MTLRARKERERERENEGAYADKELIKRTTTVSGDISSPSWRSVDFYLILFGQINHPEQRRHATKCLLIRLSSETIKDQCESLDQSENRMGMLQMDQTDLGKRQ